MKPRRELLQGPHGTSQPHDPPRPLQIYFLLRAELFFLSRDGPRRAKNSSGQWEAPPRWPESPRESAAKTQMWFGYTVGQRSDVCELYTPEMLLSIFTCFWCSCKACTWESNKMLNPGRHHWYTMSWMDQQTCPTWKVLTRRPGIGGVNTR